MPGKVLFIAHRFPPIASSGTFRPAKFVKYLPQFGWQPYVIATDQPYGEEGWDKTLLADIPPDVQVWRIPTPRPRPVERLQRIVGWKPAHAVHSTESLLTSKGASIPSSSLAKCLRRAILSPLYLVQEPPVDDALYWSLRIVPLALRIIKREQIDVVFTTAPPWSLLLTGLLLQGLTQRPWIADFRDPWTDNTFIYFSSGARRWFDEQLERLLITQADAVISVTEPCLQGLREKAAGRGRNKPFVLIPNGWDRGDFPEVGAGRFGAARNRSENHKVVLLHPGSAYRGEPIPILKALEQLSECGEVVERLRFHFVGYMHPEDQSQIADSPQRSLFQIERQRVPHPVAIRLMRESQVLLLLLLRKGPGASSGKIFEYMVAGRPVLAIGSGVAADLVQQSGIGCTVHPDDYDGLAGALRQIALDYQGFVAEHYHPNWEVINQYDRRLLTEKLAMVFDQVVCGK